MNPREVIASAWAITKKERQVRRWGYVAAVLETLLNTKLFIYQTWFIISYIQGNPIGFFADVEWLATKVSTGALVTIVTLFLLLLVIEWLFPNFARGAIIGLSAKSYKNEEVKGGLVLALYNFFPMFALKEIFFLSSIPLCITLVSLLLRYAPEGAVVGTLLIALFYLFSVLLSFLFIFSEEAVVIRKMSLGQAMRNSFKLVISYLGHVVFLIILGFVISLRIFLNALIIFLIPGIVLGIGALFMMVLPDNMAMIAWGIAGIIGLILIGFTSYLFAYLEVFRQNIWTITYLELSRLKELDVIEE